MNRPAKHALGFALLWTLVITAPAAARADETIEQPHDAAILYLRDGDYLAGQLVNCTEPDVVRWQMRGAARPYDLRAAAVRAVYFPVLAAGPETGSDYIVELTDGDLLFGSLESVTSDEFVFDTTGFGKLRIDRHKIRRITSAGDAGVFEYRGPNGLADWTPASPEQWRDEAGRLITKEPRARVEKEIDLPKRARVEFEIAWNGKPEFILSIAAGGSDQELKEGFRFEVWQNALVVIRALGDHADVAIVCELDASEKRIQLEALVDQERGLMIVCGPDGKQLAEIDVAPEHAKHGKSLKCISISNGRSEFRLERLAVSRWSGQLPPQVDAKSPGVLQSNGSVRYGDVIGYDAENRKFTVHTIDGEEEIAIAADEVTYIFPAPYAESTGYTCRVALQDGSQISGELSQVHDGQVYLKRRGIEEPVTCPIDQLRSLVATHDVAKPPTVAGRMGRLESDGVRLHGSLVAASTPATDRETCLVWLPRWSTTDSPLTPDVSGRIVYRDPPPKPKPVPRGQRELQRLRRVQRRPAQPPGFWGQLANMFTSDNAPVTTPPKSVGKGTLYMLSGDCLPYDSVEIDEEGVRFQSSFVDAKFVPHAEVKALELMPKWTAAALAEEKRQRLLTLPRMQKPNPPTHLVASTGGDFLRARLTSMSADKLQIESRLEAKQIPRDRVACIIWLHSENALAADETKADSPATADTQLRVQAVRTDGPRLTFSPRECTERELVGTSELLGPCRVDLAAIDILNLGRAIGRAAEEQPFQAWALADAVEPKYLTDDVAGGTSPAPASGLIGKPAPDVRLKLLDGKEFQLADHTGHVVVLDFWASWCGPCMQAMPEVDSVVKEFSDRGVRLIAVNLQEDRDSIQSALERLKINPTVALDVDGALAEHYQVTAIPQTVVIDAEGVVTHLFVGAAPGMPAELRAELVSLLEDATSP